MLKNAPIRRPKTTSFLVLIASMFISACSVVGSRSGTEQPPYSLVGKVGEHVELRQYQDRLAAKVTLEISSDDTQKRNEAFSILADYIFGNNRANSKFAMTAPVSAPASTQKIAMTAPVAANTSNDVPYAMSFFLPSALTLESAPEPNDPRIKLIDMPFTTMAVLRFSGSRGDQRVEEFKMRLLNELSLTEWRVVGEPVAYFYDPPWTISSLRRNEIAVPVSRKTSGSTKPTE